MEKKFQVIVRSSDWLSVGGKVCGCAECDNSEVAFEPCTEAEAKLFTRIVRRVIRSGRGRKTNVEDGNFHKALHRVLGFPVAHRYVDVSYVEYFEPVPLKRYYVPEAIRRLHNLERGSQ